VLLIGYVKDPAIQDSTTWRYFIPAAQRIASFAKIGTIAKRNLVEAPQYLPRN
jgi:hypothetical protein